MLNSYRVLFFSLPRKLTNRLVAALVAAWTMMATLSMADVYFVSPSDEEAFCVGKVFSRDAIVVNCSTPSGPEQPSVTLGPGLYWQHSVDVELISGANYGNIYDEAISEMGIYDLWAYSPDDDTAHITIWALVADMDIDGVADANEETVGGFIGRNCDRKKITLGKIQPGTWTGNAVLSRNNSKVKVFTAATGGTEITFNGTDNKFANSVLDKDLWGDGATLSDSLRDVELSLAPEGLSCSDIVKFTVFQFDIEEIQFNHNTSSMTDDGVTIKKDESTDIVAPEWKPANNKNYPACYINSKTPKVKVKLKVQPDSITTTKIRAVSENEDLPSLNQKTVTFSGGESGLEEFTMATALPGIVTTILDSWQWKVSDVNGSGSAECDTAETGEHKVYIVLDTPIEPMAKPWTNVLELACHANWASGQSSAASAVEAIGKAIYQSLAPLPHQINYNGSSPWYSYKTTQDPDELGDGWYFHLTEFFGDIATADVVLSCACVANLYEIVIAAIGVDGQWKALDVDPDAENLVDYIAAGTGISCKWYDPIGSPSWSNNGWGFHQVLLYNGNIYDACIKSDSNDDPVNHNPVWLLGLDETTYEGLLGSYNNSMTKTGHVELK